MGLGGISPWSLLLILIIVMMLFGTKRLRNMGSDLGETFKNFKKAMKDGEGEVQDQMTHKDSGRVIDAEVKEKDKV